MAHLFLDMNVFDTAIATLFADPNLASDVTFVPKQGAIVQLRVIIRAPDVYQNIGQSTIESLSFVLEVKITDCPIIAQDDRFLIARIMYIVQGTPRRDSERLVWLVDLYAA